MMNSSIEERGMLYLGFHSRTQDQMTEVQISRVLITVVDVQIRTKDVSMAGTRRWRLLGVLCSALKLPRVCMYVPGAVFSYTSVIPTIAPVVFLE